LCNEKWVLKQYYLVDRFGADMFLKVVRTGDSYKSSLAGFKIGVQV